MTSRTSIFLAIFALSPCAARAQTPCAPHYDPSFAAFLVSPAVNGDVLASAMFDDGNGPKLYIAGDFERIGSTLCRNIASWDGEVWRALGGAYSPNGYGNGVASSIRALAVFDDGSGSALYAGGSFSTNTQETMGQALARWNGSEWSVPGGGVTGDVRALAVHDDGSGAKLYAGGHLTNAGGTPVARIARWDGSSWSAVGAGITNNASSFVTSLASYDAGFGPELYAGGQFLAAQGAPGNLIARWNGTGWSNVTLGLAGSGSAEVTSLRVFDDGGGARLFVGGYFDQAGGLPANSVAAWDGSSWSALGSGFVGDVRAFESFDDGGGAELYTGGYMFSGSSFGFYRWDGGVWSSVGGGVTGGSVDTLRSFDDGSGARLFVGGSYSGTAGLALPHATAWDGATFEAIGSAPAAAHGLDGGVYWLHAHDDGDGPALYASGGMSSRVVRWTGAGWATLGSGLTAGYAFCLASFDDGSGPALYVGGSFAAAGGVPAMHIARWDGVGWSALGSGVHIGGSGGYVQEALVFDDGSGPALYVAGSFTNAGGLSVSNIARWNGAAWSDVGGGLGDQGQTVQALCVFDDGTGAALYAGGRFDLAGSTEVHAIAKWDGASWSAVGTGVGMPVSGGTVYALEVFDDGTGARLYAGGFFSHAGGIPTAAIASWDGATWAALPGALAPAHNAGAPYVHALRAFDDGDGPALFVGGLFSAAGSVGTGSLAMLRATGWSAPGPGAGVGGQLSRTVLCLEPFDDQGDGRADLFVGGSFYTAGGYLSTNVACWRGCAETVTSFCAGDGFPAICPCANVGASGHGCENSAATGGALLSASGLANPDTLVLTASGELDLSLSIFLQGDAEIAPLSFGDGLRCVGGSLKRLYVKNASGGSASAPEGSEPGISERSAQLGDPILPGSTRRYQTYYRDPSLGFCPAPGGSSFNITNALLVRW